MDASLLANLPDQTFAFALLLARVGCACMMLPGIGEAELPAMLRAGFAVAISALLLPAISPLVPAIPANGMAAGLMVVAEVVTGLWFGWLTRLLILALPIAGQVIGSLAGWSNVLQPDAVMGGRLRRSAGRWRWPLRSPCWRAGCMRCRWRHLPAATG